MCTVTIIPKGDHDFILTSNRDEAPNRVCLSPDFYTVKETKMLFPKDEKAGGTWIGVSEKNRVVCLLNGAFVRHERQQHYRLSRGVVVNDFMAAETIESTVEHYNFDNIEPFTMVIADWNTSLKFLELVWDGKNKHATELPLVPRIWSSATLYNETMTAERLEWFNRLKSKNRLNSNSILKFHKTAGANNNDYGVIMNRGVVKTTSITQIEKTNASVAMHYERLQDGLVVNKKFNFLEVINE